MMISDIKTNLSQLQNLLEQIDPKIYSQSFEELSNASIGQHIRHIVELFQALDSGYESGIVCYDNRKRDPLIELDPNAALSALDQILLNLLKEDKELQVDYQFLSNQQKNIQSSYQRELLYNLEHSIHHQAIIKVALRTLRSVEIDENFGVAPSTIRYRLSLNQ
ncbi:MAG: DinB family protein [Flavobacteriaceae bacterium]|nr:DinB family protein [Flavobacteriaceae bacterium]NVJ71736.1 DinB family protein [Flavobacteriaceae bacterium]